MLGGAGEQNFDVSSSNNEYNVILIFALWKYSAYKPQHEFPNGNRASNNHNCGDNCISIEIDLFLPCIFMRQLD
jgi:hypothetical protein